MNHPPQCIPNEFERNALANFAQILPEGSAMRKDCEDISAAPVGVPIIPGAFDRCMKAWRAWLVFGEMPNKKT